MLGTIRRILGRRKLAPVVQRLPAWLSQNFGARDQYSPGQVRRAASELRLDEVSTTLAIAAYCTADDFHTAFPSEDVEAYHGIRQQLSDMFELSSHDFTIKELRRLGVAPASSLSGNPPGESTGSG